MLSARFIAATIAAVLATITLALALALAPVNSASAIARTEAVRFSMFELAADSVRNRIAANGAISPPSSASKRMISLLASSASTSASAGKSTVRSAMSAAIAAS